MACVYIYEYERYIQYFRKRPDENILKKVLNCFDMKEVCCHTRLSRIHCEEYEVIYRMKQLLPDLSKYYVASRIKTLFTNVPLTFYNCITILRNMLSVFNYIIIAKEYMYSNQKRRYHLIQPKIHYQKRKNKTSIKINRSEKILIDFK